MDRITKLLGGHKHGAKPSSSEQVFGLKFTFDSGESMIFPTSPVTIGRQQGNHIVLKDANVSAHHARIYYDEKVTSICVIDIDSLNGIFVNDLPTRKNVLHDGDRIRFGSATLTFWDTGYIHS
jgi:pSer/pThr/pTyr-binding forkhead associated (FHA) protein